MNRYILQDNFEPVISHVLIDWAIWFETANRTLAENKEGDIRVSTVFLGLDHSYGGEIFGHAPILWQTMIFGGEHNNYQERYETKEQALVGHIKACELAFGKDYFNK